MSRTVLWILIAIGAAVLIIGGTVWLLRTRDIGGLPTFTNLTQTGQTPAKSAGTVYDPPSNFIPKNGNAAPVQPPPEAAAPDENVVVPMVQLPASMNY